MIPCHKATFSRDELLSLARALTILHSHDIFLLAPCSMGHSIQNILCEKLSVRPEDLRLHLIPDRHLESIHTYNQLMLSLDFYRGFTDYSHLLIYQLDSYVFKDELIKWCCTDWDYIGGPIYYPRSSPYGEKFCQCIGAGGFSLRKISSFIKVLNKNPTVFTWKDFFSVVKPFNKKGKLFLLSRFVRCSKGVSIRLSSNAGTLDQAIGINEDVILGLYLPKYQPWFKVPGYRDAASFCIDYHVTQELSAMDGELPFGTHAWCTTSENREAWRLHIQQGQAET